QAMAAKNNADAGKTTQETQIAAHQQALQQLANVNTPDDAVAWMVQHVKTGALPAGGIQQGLAALQQAAQDPSGKAFQQWKAQAQQAGMTVQQQMEATAAKPTEVRLGNVVKIIDTNPRSATFGKEVVGAQAIGVSPDTVATQAGENSRNAATNATSRANNAANIQKDMTVAGLSPDGQGVNQNVEQMAQAIASGRAAPITGFALAKPQGQTVMRRVFEINPQYDETGYTAKNKAARDFATGNQGNAMRSFATAGQHLDQLGELVDALGNGNNQTVNKVSNAISTWTGGTAPTNFEAAKDIVSKEVVKAIVGSGGGVAERGELANMMNNAKTPAQLKGVIQQYRSLMSAQHDNLLAQRRAAGLPDATLPQYTDSKTPGKVVNFTDLK
ncbi:MAG: hypothetical protein JWP42_1728, partial [Pseudomonas sp.]|nr:hypothetical protein [Pseudomonas sp.]